MFTSGGATDVARSHTYFIDLEDANLQRFDSAELELTLERELKSAGLELERVQRDSEADLHLFIRIDPVAGSDGAGLHAGVHLNPDRLRPTVHQLLYGYDCVASTPETALHQFAKHLADGVRGAAAHPPVPPEKLPN